VLAGGKIQLEGAPADLIRSLEGKVWRRPVSRVDLPAFQSRYNVISTRTSDDRTVVHVLSETSPGDGFERVNAGLEDVYLTAVNASRRPA